MSNKYLIYSMSNNGAMLYESNLRVSGTDFLMSDITLQFQCHQKRDNLRLKTKKKLSANKELFYFYNFFCFFTY